MSKLQSFRTKYISFLFDRKSLFIISGSFLFTLIVFILSIGIGDMQIGPIEVVKTLFGYGTEMNTLVVHSFRLPRIVLALIAGSALAVSGAILQAIIRNPLASPDLIGITWGGAFATISFFAIFSDRSNALTVSIQWLPLASFIGALIIAIIVYILSWKNGISPTRLILIGVGISAVMQALSMLMMIIGPIYRASQANIWITGSVHGANWNQAIILGPLVIFLLGIALIYARKLNIQELGEDISKGVGSMVERDRLVLLCVSTALAGGAVAFAGGIGFVGLMAPHIARKLVGSTFGAIVPVSALIGGAIVMTADILARTLFSPLQVPAGVFTAAIGAPYFIYLLYRNRK
ncbi:FecCD family ABC transporter permease [Bacillus taeanensis]|uniref:Iron ABC transporter permease n=1 Tax=Bacillus taeanensis TaxID=273032 RepID=A0A366XR87_9BACI|nr:iron ABC transporter permease [Bacillus taeanensis]RBW68038.1 iron ABC transporter permease [Bacillus taeanensis]